MDALKQKDSLRTHAAERGEEGARTPLSERVRSLRLPHSSAPDGSGGRWFPWTLCVLLAGTTAVFGYLAFGRPEADDAAAVGPAGTDAGEVETGSAALPSEGGIVLESKGHITPARQILVSPKVSGMVVELPIEEGQRVKQGDVLARLETDEYQADYDRAAASLSAAMHRRDELQRYRPEEIGQARAELAEAQAQLEQLQDQWDRDQQLHKKNKNLISQQEYEASQSQFHAMERRVERLKFAYDLMEAGPRVERKKAAEAEVKQSEAELAKARWRLDNCTILAPISGTILKKNAEEGNIVNTVAFNGSFSLCEMANLADLEVELLIAERDVAKVFQGQRCKVRAEAYQERVYQGWVDRIMPIADRGRAAIPVRVKVRVPREEEGVYLKPEMGAIVTFLSEKVADK